MGLLLWALVASAQVEPEEIVVYGDPLAPWDGTRWWVAAESLSATGALRMDTPIGRLEAPAWQVSAVLYCQVLGERRGRVECTPEDVAVRLATADHWQREADRRRVEGAVQDLRRSMMGARVQLKVRGHGTVRPLQGHEDTTELAGLLLERALDAFYLDLPDGGFRDGDRWEALDEPLLDLSEAGDSFGFERVVHSGHAFRGHHVIQTLGETNKETVVAIQTGPVYPEEVTVGSTLRLEAAAIYDHERGFVTERVWSVTGTGSVRLRRIGRLQLLDDDGVVPVGPSGQVAPPGQVRPELPAWTPLEAM